MDQVFYIFDVSDPLYPIPVGWFNAVNFYETMSINDNYCYFYERENTDQLVILDTLKPTKPKIVGMFPNLVKAGAEISISDNLAIAQESDDKIAILSPFIVPSEINPLAKLITFSLNSL